MTRTATLAAFAAALLIAAPTWAGEFTNHIGMRFVDIPAGSFWMGSCKMTSAQVEENKKRAFLGQPPVGGSCAPGTRPDPEADDDETPQREVRVSAFQMGVFEVTLGQFKKFMATRTDLVTDEFMKYNVYGDDVPVTIVSWTDAKAFVEWLNRTKPASDRGAYRLSSEAEWEYAARAGTASQYSWGDDPAAAGQHAWYDGNARQRPQSAGRLKANRFGLYDMHGNVWEWVEDCWNDSYNGAPTNGAARTSGKCEFRVVRGGSWGSGPGSLRLANRSPGNRDYFVGFRVARALML